MSRRRDAPVDPFASTADPEAYVPRAATEAALQHLAQGFSGARRVQVLTGPPGIGKTMLLRVLAQRLDSRFRTLYLPYASMTFSDLCSWILGLLAESPDAHPDAEQALFELAQHGRDAGRPMLLLIDDASTMPDDTAHAVAALVVRAEGAIRVLLVPAEDSRTAHLLGAIAPDAPELRLSAPFAPEESARFVHTRLEGAHSAPEVVSRFTPEIVGLIHRLSGGVPRLLGHLADEVVRGNAGSLPGQQTKAELVDPLDAAPPDSPPQHAGEAGLAPAEAGVAPSLEVDPAAEPEAEPVMPEPRFATPGDLDALRAPPPPPVAIRGSEAAPKRMALVVAINLVLAAGIVAVLWLTGFFPPP